MDVSQLSSAQLDALAEEARTREEAQVRADPNGNPREKAVLKAQIHASKHRIVWMWEDQFLLDIAALFPDDPKAKGMTDAYFMNTIRHKMGLRMNISRVQYMKDWFASQAANLGGKDGEYYQALLDELNGYPWVDGKFLGNTLIEFNKVEDVTQE